MSLFSSSPETTVFHTPSTSNKRTSNTLFEPDNAKQKTDISASGSLFADDTSKVNSDWGFPTAKRHSKVNLVDKLLPSDEVPQEYIEVFDLLLQGSGSTKAVPLSEIQQLLDTTELEPSTRKQILQIITSGGGAATKDFSRGEVNVLLALIGLAEEAEDLSLDAVDERRKRTFDVMIPQHRVLLAY